MSETATISIILVVPKAETLPQAEASQLPSLNVPRVENVSFHERELASIRHLRFMRGRTHARIASFATPRGAKSASAGGRRARKRAHEVPSIAGTEEHRRKVAHCCHARINT